MYPIYDLRTYDVVFYCDSEAEANFAIANNEWLFYYEVAA